MGGTIVACGFTLYSGYRPLSLIQGHSFYLSSDETTLTERFQGKITWFSLSPALYSLYKKLSILVKFSHCYSTICSLSKLFFFWWVNSRLFSKCFHLVIFLGFLAEFSLLFKGSTRISLQFGLPSSCLLLAERIYTGSIDPLCHRSLTLWFTAWVSVSPCGQTSSLVSLGTVSLLRVAVFPLKHSSLSAHRGQLWKSFLPCGVSVLAFFDGGELLPSPSLLLVRGCQYGAHGPPVFHFQASISLMR